MKEVNVLYAFTYKDQNTAIVSYIKKKMETELSSAGVTVLSIETVKSKDQIEEKLDTGKYNVLICKEQLGEEKISSGSLKVWGNRYPEVAVILNVSNDKKGGEKLVKFLSSTPSYYNVLYDNDLTGENVAKLLNYPRTKEEAIVYYGLENRLTEQPKASGTVMEVKSIPVTAMEREEEGNKENFPEEEVIEEITKEEFDKVVSGFEAVDFDEKVFGNGAKEKPEILDADTNTLEDENGKEVDFATMFDGKDLFEEVEKEHETNIKVMNEDRKKEVQKHGDNPVEDKETPTPMKAKKVGEKSSTANQNDIGDNDMDFTVRQMDGITFPDTANVLKVFDQNTMLVKLLCAPVLPKDKTMEDYKLLFVVKGTRGGFVNGKYRVGVKSFEGYPGKPIGKQTVIVEVPEYDLIENALEGAYCSLIFLEQ